MSNAPSRTRRRGRAGRVLGVVVLVVVAGAVVARRQAMQAAEDRFHRRYDHGRM